MEVRGIEINLDPVTWVILALVGFHAVMDVLTRTVTTFTRRGT